MWAASPLVGDCDPVSSKFFKIFPINFPFGTCRVLILSLGNFSPKILEFS